MTNAEAIAILKTYDVNFYNDDGHKIRADKICEALNVAIKALEQEPSVSENPNNCEMRDATLEERESIDKYIKSISKPTGVKFGALEQEPSDDCISRQAVLENAFKIYTHECGLLEVVGVATIETLPPVKPQERTGHWIKYGKLYQCSECEELSCCQGKFCNECGVKMVEKQERSEE